MGGLKFTLGQRHRLLEIGADPKAVNKDFKTAAERNREFDRIVKNLARQNVAGLRDYLKSRKKPLTGIVEDKLRGAALALGFSEVTTPTIIPRVSVERMGISEKSGLWRQIIWVDGKRCLRPMLAPNLYAVMDRLSVFRKPVKIFEVGPCFRKDTKGPLHLEEFTMFNLVELAPECDPELRLKEIINSIIRAVGLKKFDMNVKGSEVYGDTLDVKIEDVEIASAAIGPKPIDENWGINDSWVGIGFGVERLAMLVGGYRSVARVSRSLIYLDGSRMDVK